MEPNANEDLIAATIRRVAQSKAARVDPADDPPADASHDVRPDLHLVARVEADESESGPADEDSIEATIRRVAASQAARVAETDADFAPAEPAAGGESPIAGVDDEHSYDGTANSQGIRADDGDAARWDPTEGDEDPIEATIRRVAASQAARVAETDADFAPIVTVGSDESHDIGVVAEYGREPTTDIEGADNERSVASAEFDDRSDRIEYDGNSTPLTAEDAESRWQDAPPVRMPAAHDGDSLGWQVVARGLEEELRETRREVQALARRVEQLERTPSSATPQQLRPAATPHAVDDFDDAPKVSQMSFGAPPRPAVMRDPSPQTATAEHLVPAYDEPEAEYEHPPAPAADARRGLELLPRSYRITVEDKRRGVDLVPLHRALLGMDGVRDMSLLSYSNGVAIIAIDTLGGIDPEALRSAVSRAMAREAAVEVHNEQTMVVKLAEE